jgi:malonyl CoA-acyl carrier protein transacylase
MTTYLFPGQGSQFIGMGKELFNSYSKLVETADSVLGYSIEELCLIDPNKKLNNTAYTQPALYVTNHLYFTRMIEESGKRPDFLAGHSLGEFNALCSGGAFDFETGLKIVKIRGELMARIDNGSMAAIIGLSEKEIVQIFKELQSSLIDIANYNSHKQIVVSGDTTELQQLEKYFAENLNATFIKLKVSGAFHSRYMNQAKDEFIAFIGGCAFSYLEVPVISNYTGKPYNDQNIKENLVQQLSNPVRWLQSMLYLTNLGKMTFEEIGERKILSRLLAEALN